MKFFNSMQKNLSFADVVACIKYFIKANPDCEYRIAIGTDSQVKGRYICFATGIHIHRVGQGAWCCISKRMEINRCSSLKDKISKETLITYEMAHLLNESLSDALWDFTVKYKNFNCRLEAHIDIGTNSETRKLVREMTGYFEQRHSPSPLKFGLPAENAVRDGLQSPTDVVQTPRLNVAHEV